jgi:hypothetical protein
MDTWLYDCTACTDCYATAALGAPSDDPDYTPAVIPLSSIDAGERVETGHRFPLDGDSDTREFSWTPCETCGSTLGGDRYAVSVWGR